MIQTELFNIEVVLVGLMNFVGILLAVWVFNANRKEKLNQWFAVMTFFVILWVNFAFLGNKTENSFSAVVFYRLNWMFVTLSLLAAFYFCVVHFLKQRYKILEKVILILGFIFISLSLFSNLIIKDVARKSWGNEIIFGWGNNLFNLFSFFIALIVISALIKKYFSFPEKEKLKVQYFLIGTLLFAGFNIVFNIILPNFLGTVKYQHFGDYSAIFLLGFTAYAIVKRELFGIRVVLANLLVILIAILLLINLFVSESLFEYIWKGLLLVAFIISGVLSIKSILKEIRHKEDLERLTKELESLNESLEDKVEQRTRELNEKVQELEKFYKLTVGRELKMLELKKKIESLEEGIRENKGNQ